MSESMIERVAAAIGEITGIPDKDGQEWLRGVARAAIEAMRTPTEQMIDAADETGKGGGIDDIGDEEPKIYNLGMVWQAMIAAALSEKP